MGFSPNPNEPRKWGWASRRILAAHHYWISLPWAKPGVWPGGKGIVRKKHRREKKFPRSSPRASAECGGPNRCPVRRFA